MTKKHFKAIAESFRNLDSATMYTVNRQDVYEMLLSFCKQQNPLFDEERFYAACNGLKYKK